MLFRSERAKALSPIVRELRQAGFMTLRAMADELNKRRIRTAHGGGWHPSTVSKMLERLASAKPLIAEMPTEQPLIRGRLHLRPVIARAYWNGTDVGLTLGEYKIIRVLVSNIGQQVSYRVIYDAQHYEGFIAGSGEAGYRVNVRSSMKRIRKKFMIIDPEFSQIVTFEGVGYAWRLE